MTKREVLRYESDELTAAQIAIAEKRSMSLLHNFRMMDYDLKLLLASVYLQGCRDMAQAVIANPQVLDQSDRQPFDYQI